MASTKLAVFNNDLSSWPHSLKHQQKGQMKGQLSPCSCSHFKVANYNLGVSITVCTFKYGDEHYGK